MGGTKRIARVGATNGASIVMNDSDDAATYRTDIAGWVSRDDLYFGTDERTARWSGCTHVACERCGKPTEKSWLACDGCRELNAIERFEKRPRKAWDGEAMLFSELTDEYYADLDAVGDAIADMDEPVTLADMRLVICEPNRGSPLSGEYFSDEFAEDDDEGRLPQEVWDAMEAFNKAIAEMRPLSWSPGKFAVDVNAITTATGSAS